VSRTYSSERVPCPRCREEGRDSGGDHARPFSDQPEKAWCFHGHGVVTLEEGDGINQPATNYQRTRPDSSRDTAHEMAMVAGYPIRAYEPRRISKEAMEFFGVRTAVSQVDASPVEHWYPYLDPETGQNITGYTCRTLPKGFRSVGKRDSFFGQHLTKGTHFLIIVEGEHDCLAGYDMMRKLKPERRPYNIVSLPHGAKEEGDKGPVIDKTIQSQLEWLSSFTKIVLVFDNDAVGRATANALADYLCSSTEVVIASLPLKDTAAMWEAGREKEWGQAINNAKKYVSDQIVLGTDTPLVDLMQPLKRGISFPFTPRTCNKLRGYRTKELNTLIAPPKCGKSSLLRQKVHYLLAHTSDSVGGFFLEETVEKTKQAVIAMHAGVALNEFRANPKIADRHKVQEAYDTLLPRLHLFTHRNKTIEDDQMLRKIEYMRKSLGCTRIMLDHASFVLGTRQTKDERREVDMLLTKLARSVEDDDYTLWVVSHIKRGAREQSRSDRNQKYPYWEILTPDMARSSGAYEQLSHNMIALEKQVMDPEGENTRGLVRTRILLSREWGVEGIGDYLHFDERGQFIPVEPVQDY
jgi:twinkle protein